MHIDFNQMLIVQRTRTALMLSICHLIYVCCLRLIFMPFIMTCISKHNIMLLTTLLLRIYPNYVPYGMYENGD